MTKEQGESGRTGKAGSLAGLLLLLGLLLGNAAGQATRLGELAKTLTTTSEGTR